MRHNMVATAAVAGLFTLAGYSAVAQQQPMTQPGTQPTQPQTPTGQQGEAPNTMSPRNRANLNQVDRQFMVAAAQGGMAEVMLGQLAIARASTPEVQQYARQMVQEHTNANNQLIQIAQAKGVTLPTEVNAQQKALRARLGQIPGARFDQVYMQEAGVKAHAQQRALFQREVQQGQDADVKGFATSILPKVNQHLAMANNMVVALNQGRRPDMGTMQQGVMEQR